jgi:adenine-specific DNA-methyltransferase
MIISPLEDIRLNLQLRLDQAKTGQERNRLGQFATPTALAHDLLAHTVRYLPPGADVRFLDPAFGTGSFYSALLRALPDKTIASATSYEIDRHYGDEAVKLCRIRRFSFTLRISRALNRPLDVERANLLICNPPYVRHHHIDSAEKQRLQQLVEQQARIRLSGLNDAPRSRRPRAPRQHPGVGACPRGKNDKIGHRRG